MNITITINAPGLTDAINALATSLSTNSGVTPVTQQPTQQQAPQQAVQQMQTAVPTQQASQQAPQQTAVPTTETSYTMEQLAVAATQLVDAGKREELLQLLNSFGVQALTTLPKAEYGTFATKLREKGAKI